MIEDSFIHSLGPGRLPKTPVNHRNITAVIVPHAGYMYSGPGAAHSYLYLAEEAKPDTIVILGPNHTGLGSPISMMDKGGWETPLGVVPIDENLAKELFNVSDIIDINESAHTREHSIEVQLPFLQYIYGDFKFIPICMGYQDLKTSTEVGNSLAKVLKDKEALIIASTDLTHQETQESAARKDRMIIDAILEMDETKLQDNVRRNRITTCGYGPMSVALVASKQLGALKAILLSYHTSGDIIKEYSAVVGYMSAIITK
jgi:AmmeMemoRadiSam system protein B